jgi:hypothetical protein
MAPNYRPMSTKQNSAQVRQCPHVISLISAWYNFMLITMPVYSRMRIKNYVTKYTCYFIIEAQGKLIARTLWLWAARRAEIDKILFKFSYTISSKKWPNR